MAVAVLGDAESIHGGKYHRVTQIGQVGDLPDGEMPVGIEMALYAGYYECPSSPFANQIAETVEKAAGKKPVFRLSPGGTDGISTSRIAGIPSIAYGTSLTGQAHQPDERITIENLVLGSKYIRLSHLSTQTKASEAPLISLGASEAPDSIDASTPR